MSFSIRALLIFLLSIGFLGADLYGKPSRKKKRSKKVLNPYEGSFNTKKQLAQNDNDEGDDELPRKKRKRKRSKQPEYEKFHHRFEVSYGESCLSVLYFLHFANNVEDRAFCNEALGLRYFNYDFNMMINIEGTRMTATDFGAFESNTTTYQVETVYGVTSTIGFFATLNEDGKYPMNLGLSAGVFSGSVTEDYYYGEEDATPEEGLSLFEDVERDYMMTAAVAQIYFGIDFAEYEDGGRIGAGLQLTAMQDLKDRTLVNDEEKEKSPFYYNYPRFIIFYAKEI